MRPERQQISDLTTKAAALFNDLSELQMELEEENEHFPPDRCNAMEKSFERFDPEAVPMEIRERPLYLSPGVRQEVENLGLRPSSLSPGNVAIEVLQKNIMLIRKHVSFAAQAGSCILINHILLHVTSTMSTKDTCINMIPEFPVPRTTFPNNISFEGIIDFLLAKLSSNYSSHFLEGGSELLNHFPGALHNPACSAFFVAQKDYVHEGISQVAMVVATYCHKHKIPVLRGCITSGEQWIFFIYKKKEEGKGEVAYSQQFSLEQDLENLPFILGLLVDWVDNSTEPTQRFFS